MSGIRRRRGGWSKRTRIVGVLLLVLTQTGLAVVAHAAVLLPTSALRDPVLAAAGDIACPSTDPGFHATGGGPNVLPSRLTFDALLSPHPPALASLCVNPNADA